MRGEDSSRTSKNEGQRKLAGILALFIAIAVFISFWPTLNNGFVNWDDKAVLLENQNYRGLTGSHLSWMIEVVPFFGQGVGGF